MVELRTCCSKMRKALFRSEKKFIPFICWPIRTKSQTPEDGDAAKKKTKKKAQLKPELAKYMNSKPHLIAVKDFIPDRFFRLKKFLPYYSFTVDDHIAGHIVDTIKEDLIGDATVVDGSPGLGLITRHLLKIGIPKVLVFDPMFTPSPPLVQLMNDNPDKISVIPSNFFEVHKFIIQDKYDDGNRFDTVFKDVKHREWTEPPSVKVIGVLHSTMYVHNLLKSISFSDAFTKIGRIEHYLVISERLYQNLVNAKGRMRMNIYMIFNEFFDVKIKTELPRQAFLPWVHDAYNSQTMYLIKLTPKCDIYERYDEQNLKVLWRFLQDICRSKHNKIIAYFEKWMPSSGLVLIRDGLSPMTQVGDLSAPELIRVFNTFINLPEYADTNYFNIQESGFMSEKSDQMKDR